MIIKSDGTIIVIVKGDSQCLKNNQKNQIASAADAEKTAADPKDQQTRSVLQYC